MAVNAYLRRIAGAEPLPKRMAPESWVAASRRRTTGVLAIFLEALRTAGCFLLDMSGFSLSRLSIGFKLRMPHWVAAAFGRCLFGEAFINPPSLRNNERFGCSGALLGTLRARYPPFNARQGAVSTQ